MELLKQINKTYKYIDLEFLYKRMLAIGFTNQSEVDVFVNYLKANNVYLPKEIKYYRGTALYIAKRSQGIGYQAFITHIGTHIHVSKREVIMFNKLTINNDKLYQYINMEYIREVNNYGRAIKAIK